MKTNKRLFPEYRGFEFWITELDNGYTLNGPTRYGYNLQSVKNNHAEGGGSYPSKHEATKAAFARIETLTFDR